MRKSLSPPNPKNAPEPDQYTDQFRAVVKYEGCERCGRGRVYQVVGLDGVQARRFRGEKAFEAAEDLAYFMSRAYERGVKAAKEEGSK